MDLGSRRIEELIYFEAPLGFGSGVAAEEAEVLGCSA
jgi:hypothetical protein